jgi:hypothetical protein
MSPPKILVVGTHVYFAFLLTRNVSADIGMLHGNVELFKKRSEENMSLSTLKKQNI